MENFTYATVKGSSVDMYFRRQVQFLSLVAEIKNNIILSIFQNLKTFFGLGEGGGQTLLNKIKYSVKNYKIWQKVNFVLGAISLN